MFKLIGFAAEGQAGVGALLGLQLIFSFAAFGGEARPRLERQFRQLPLAFERNEGQAPPWAEFVARGPGYLVGLSRGEAVLVFPGRGGGPKRVRMKLSGSAAAPAAHLSGRLPGLSHYFLGRDPSTWRTHVPQFSRVTFHHVYAGVSATYYGNQGRLEYDFLVEPGADASRIELEFEGAATVRLDPDGDVVLPLGDAEARLHAPQVYQQTGGGRRSLWGRHVVRGNRVRFEVENHDPRYPLVIDPVLSYSTTLGGSTAGRPVFHDLAVDASGDTYVAGCAALGMTMLTPYLENLTTQDVFLAKLSSDGTTLLYSTYLGAGCASAIALDPDGNIVVAGATSSTVFPLRHPAYSRAANSFLAKLRADGSELIYSTYLEGDATDAIGGVAADPLGNAIVTRTTGLSGVRTTVTLPPIPAPVMSVASPRIGVIQKFGPEGALLYAAVLGRGITANGVATDAFGAAYVAGATCGDLAPLGAAGLAVVPKDCDSYVAKLSPGAEAFDFVRTLGGSGWDGATHVAVDAEGSAYVTGITFSADFPVIAAAPQKTLRGVSDAFVAKLNASGGAVVWATYLGGTGEESPSGIAVDGAGQATVAGTTTSADFPVAGALRPLKNGAAQPLHLSDSAGREWTAIAPGARDPRPWTGSIVALAAAPDDPRTVYAVDQVQVAGRAPAGFSLYRSADGGATWTTACTEAGDAIVYGVAVRPGSAAGVYLATDAGLRFSPDGGVTWSPRGAFATTGAARELNLLVSRVDPDRLFVFLRRAANPQLWRSPDAGLTWQEAGELPRGPQTMALDPADRDTLYLGADAGLFKSVDGGATWQQLGPACPGPNLGPCQYQELLVAPGDPPVLLFLRRGGRDYGYLNQQSELNRSLDGGRTWTSSPLPILADATALAVDPANREVIYAGFGGTGVNGIFRSLDGGANWTPLGPASPFWTDAINALLVVPLGPSRLLAGTPATTDGFVTTFYIPGSGFTHSSYLGGPAMDRVAGPKVDESAVYVTVGTSIQRLDYSAAPCDLVTLPVAITSHSLGNTHRVQVRTAGGCPWRAETTDPWLAILSPASGTGNSPIEVLVAPNATGSLRTGQLVVNGEAVEITQAGAPPCTLTPQAVRVLSSGKNDDGFSFTFTQGCKWKLASDAAWLTITGAGAGGSTDWVIPYTVQANPGRTARRATITITAAGDSATAVHTVLQAGTSCSARLTASAERLPAAGGEVTLDLASEPAGCVAWVADSGATWAALLPGTFAGGIGSGTVTFRVTANTGLTERTTRLQMGGQSVRITQDAVDCQYRLAPATQTIASAQFTSVVTVFTASACTWTAVSDSPWLRVTGMLPPRSGSFSGTPAGNGRVNYRVDANSTGAPRTGTITVAGRAVFTLTQAAAE